MSIYDVALLAECQQIIDSENQSRHNVEVVVKDIRDIILPDLSVFDRIHSTIISMIEESLVEEFDEEDC